MRVEIDLEVLSKSVVCCPCEYVSMARLLPGRHLLTLNSKESLIESRFSFILRHVTDVEKRELRSSPARLPADRSASRGQLLLTRWKT